MSGNVDVPIFGGVLDGTKRTLPITAEDGFTATLTNDMQGPDYAQSTDYMLRVVDGQRTLVPVGARWPLLEASPA